MSAPTGVTIVTQTCVRPEHAEAFSRWQTETSTLIAKFPGFVEQRLMPPNPPLQVDWVIMQRFRTLEDAQRWLGSTERHDRIEGISALLVGRDDVHIVQDSDEGAPSAPITAMISTRVRPGKEAEYREWEHRIAAAQSQAPGLQGYRFEPPVPGVQEDYVAILRFDSEENLQAWIDSPERKALLAEAAPLTEEFHTRLVRSGFEQWFGGAAAKGSAPLPVWKMNMIVLLLLYPIVFLWSVFVGAPLLGDKLHLSFATSLFVGNIFSVAMTGFLVPWVAGRMGWWLQPAGASATRASIGGAVLILAIYAAMVLAFRAWF
jgi:antibiotic biosynthesis monooxygenase (ABM) superfamily enzyme